MFLILIGFLFLVVYLYVWTTSSKFKKPPLYPGCLPIIGHGHLLYGDSKHLWTAIQDLGQVSVKLGGVILAKIGPAEFYVITDPDDFLTIANSCLNKNYLYKFAKTWLGDGLATVSSESWKHHRRVMNPAFNLKVLEGFVDIFNRQSRRLVNNMTGTVGKGPLNFTHCFGLISLETVCITVLGLDVHKVHVISEDYEKLFNEMYAIYTRRAMNVWVHFDGTYKFTEMKKREDINLEKLKSFSHEVVKQRRIDIKNNKTKTYEDSGTKFKPLLDLLLELSENSDEFTDELIRQEVDTIMAAGHESTALSLLYMLLLMGSHPEVQDKVYQELQQVFDGEDRDVDKYDLTKLVYLEAVMKESLRLYPIAGIIIRYIDVDVRLKNYVIPANRNCVLHVYSINRHPIWGKDAHEFRPERWLEPGGVPNHPAAFGGFSVGKRNCIGKTFAMMQMKISLVHLLRKYRFSADISELKFKFDVVVQPHSGHFLSVEERIKN